MSNASSSINVAMSVSGGSLSRKHTINVVMSFDGVDPKTILSWATDSRIIALQRVLRATSDEYLDSLGGKLCVNAAECGGKIETPAERQRKLELAGLPAELAALAVTDPNAFAKLIASLNGKKS